ncbi:hypothetical protein N8I77_008605 [Diaporthe amygdali]|uniref:Uncharacterized protein n=1 Tax=Phomopsis amygdali TaxID=1214568 RepID=A0AAD9SE58_PHOAM|nr:hypothetical protein N8I77_008605 [Diaporthe amygdali]
MTPQSLQVGTTGTLHLVPPSTAREDSKQIEASSSTLKTTVVYPHEDNTIAVLLRIKSSSMSSYARERRQPTTRTQSSREEKIRKDDLEAKLKEQEEADKRELKRQEADRLVTRKEREKNAEKLGEIGGFGVDEEQIERRMPNAKDRREAKRRPARKKRQRDKKRNSLKETDTAGYQLAERAKVTNYLGP